MQKVFTALLAVVVLQLAAPAVPAHAAPVPLQQRIGDFVTQNPNLLQQVVEVKQDLDEGNREAALNKVVATVVANSNSEIVSLLASGNLRETVETGLLQGVESRVREEVEQRIGDKLLPYQSQITAVAQLLNL